MCMYNNIYITCFIINILYICTLCIDILMKRSYHFFRDPTGGGRWGRAPPFCIPHFGIGHRSKQRRNTFDTYGLMLNYFVRPNIRYES